MLRNPFGVLQSSSDEEEVLIEINSTPNTHSVFVQEVQINNTNPIQEDQTKNTNEIQEEIVEELREELKEELKEEINEEPKEENTDPDHPTPEQIKNCPTLFQALGFSENRRVLLTFIGISLALVIVGFGSFYLGKIYIPKFFPSIDPFDAPIYSCGLAVVLTQAIIFTFYFWAWGHDVAEEKREKELEEQARREARGRAKKFQ